MPAASRREPIDLDLAGVRRLTILVDFGDSLSTGDHLLLVQREAQQMKRLPAWQCAILAWRLSACAPRAEPAAAVLDAESQRIAVIDKAKDCVLAIFSPNGQGGGSGVVISPDGYALTNFHVVQPCGKAMQCGMADGKLYDAVIVGIDPTGDVALVKLFGRDDFPCAELGDSDQVRAGDWVFAMGNPFLLATDLQPTVTYGIVSGVHRYQFPVGHAAGIHRLPPDRRLDQPGQLGRAAVRRPRAADRHQRPRLVRETRPGERRRRLRHLDQPDQELPRATCTAAGSSITPRSAPGWAPTPKAASW